MKQVLTPIRYKAWEELEIGDEVIGYDPVTKTKVINEIESIEIRTAEDYPDEEFVDYIINGKLRFFMHQTVFANVTNHASIDIVTGIHPNIRGVHAFELGIGDKIYTDEGEEVEIKTIEKVAGESWVRFTISGDHSYIADGIALHNAARFWVTGGVDDLWATIGNWSLTSGGAGGQTVPSSSDDVTLDNLGNHACTIQTINRAAKTFTIVTGYTSLITFTTNLAVSGSITVANTAHTYAGAGLLRMIAAGTWTTNGKTIGVAVEIGGTTTFTCTLADALTTNTAMTWTNTTSTIFSGAFNIACAALTISGSQTVTMSGNINPTGLVTIADANLLAGSFTITCPAGITATGTLGISANSPAISLTGGTWSGSAICSVPITFAGNVTISGSVSFSGTLTYTSGTITTTGSELQIAGGTATTLNVAAITWNDITITGTSKTYTLTGNLNWSGTLTDSTVTAVTWSGAYTMIGGAITYTTAGTRNYNVTSVACSTNTMPDTAITLAGSLSTYTCTTWTNTIISAARTHTLTETISFIMTNFSPVTPTAAAGTIRLLTITSAHASTKVVFKCAITGTQTVAFVSATRLDSSGGQCLLTLGTITTSYNWTTSVSSQNILNAGGGEANTIAGITKDNSGAALGSCDCYLFRDNGNNSPTYVAYQQSNASTGAYSFTVFAGSTYFVVAFKGGATPVMDATDRTLVAV